MIEGVNIGFTGGKPYDFTVFKPTVGAFDHEPAITGTVYLHKDTNQCGNNGEEVSMIIRYFRLQAGDLIRMEYWSAGEPFDVLFQVRTDGTFKSLV